MKRLLTTTTKSSSSRFRFPSIGFSGAGFLGSYHAGVYASLLKHNHLLQPMERHPDSSSSDNDRCSPQQSQPPILTGVSAGALISSAISVGVTPEDAMATVLTVAERTREKGGLLDVIRPGFSLVDELEEPMRREMQKALGGDGSSSDDDYDIDMLQNRTKNGELLRIGLSDRRTMDITSFDRDLSSYLYVDRYRDLDDVLAASVLSSYIPFGTGPLRPEVETVNLSVKKAWKRIRQMERLGFVKNGVTGVPLQNGDTEAEEENHTVHTANTDMETDANASPENDNKVLYIDGGLVNMFPEIDASTVIVSPLNGSFVPPFIAPQHIPSEFQKKLSELTDDGSNNESSLLPKRTLDLGPRTSIGLNTSNLREAYLMAHSSGPDVLEERFRNGYDDTERFLKECDARTVFSV